VREPRRARTLESAYTGLASRLQMTAKIRRFVDAASALVRGDLRIRTERASPIDLTCSFVGSDDLLRSFALLNPLFNRVDLVECIRPLSA